MIGIERRQQSLKFCLLSPKIDRYYVRRRYFHDDLGFWAHIYIKYNISEV